MKDPEDLTVWTLTRQDQIEDPKDPDLWTLEDSEVLETKDPEIVREFLRETDPDDLFSFYLTVYSGDPKDWRSDILDQVNLEEFRIDPDLFLSEYLLSQNGD